MRVSTFVDLLCFGLGLSAEYDRKQLAPVAARFRDGMDVYRESTAESFATGERLDAIGTRIRTHLGIACRCEGR